MRILFVLPWLAVGGLERVQINIANALAERGYSVTVMTLNPEAELLPELSDKVKYVYKPFKPHKIMKRIPYVRNKFYDDGMWETRASAKRLYKYYVGKEKYDVEVGFFRGLSIKIISGSTNKNSVKLAWVHNDFKLCGGYTNNFKSLKAVKKAYGKYDKIVCVSEKARENFEEVIGVKGKASTVYNLIPTDKIRVLSEEKTDAKKVRFTVLSVGHLVDQKGYDRLIGAIKRLNGDGYKIDLWLVGDGAERENLVKLADGEDYIKFFGKKTNPYAYMRQADLYVCSSRFEGFNLTVAEAVILGIPVLSTDCTGPSEILGNGEYGKIVENSEDGIYGGIKELLDNSEKIVYYRKQAQKRLDFFTEERILQKLEGLFNA